MRCALIVFAKPPVAGAVKTRLVPPLSEDNAARLYAAFVEDSLQSYAALNADTRLYMAGERAGAADPNSSVARNDVPGLELPTGIQVFSQAGCGLGARMSRAFDETFRAGYSRAVIVGTDHPTLPMAYLQRAFDALDREGAVVIGPAEDGGYYLLGMNEPHPELFRDMTYSHARVFEETMRRLGDAAGSATMLPSWYDVDRPGELTRLASDLENAPDRAPRTRAVLSELSRQEDRES